MRKNTFGMVAMVALATGFLAVSSAPGAYIKRIGIDWSGNVNCGPNRLIDSPWLTSLYGQDGRGYMFSNIPTSGTNPVNTMVYDMAGTVNLADLTVYTNGVGENTRHIKDIQIAVGDLPTGPWTVLTAGGSSILTLNGGVAGVFPDTPFTFDGYTGDHRYLQIRILNKYSSADSSGGFAAVEFNGTYATEDAWPPAIPATSGHQVSATVTASSATAAWKGPVSQVVDGITDAQQGWLGNSGNTGYIELDLGQEQTLTGMRIYRYNEPNSVSYTSRAARLITISVRDSETDPWTTVVTDWLQPFYPVASPTDYIIPNDILLDAVSARYVRLDLTGWNSGYIGLNEVMFFVPEPASMTILALAGFGALYRRRRLH